MTTEAQSIFNDMLRLSAGDTWYQRVEINGVSPPTDLRWIGSAYYDEGKWRNFIEPLLPPAGEVFAELGCNAGLFLLCAARRGYGQVIGIEGDEEWFKQCEYVIRAYQAQDPVVYRNIRLVNARVGNPGFGVNKTCSIRGECAELVLGDLPSIDVMLLSNVLYWMERRACEEFIFELSRVCRYALIVSIEEETYQSGPANLTDVRTAFASEWREVDSIPSYHAPGDSSPRAMFSVIFETRSQLVR